MIFLHSKKTFSDILEGVTSKTFSLAPFASLLPFFFCMTTALTILVMQFAILQIIIGECQ